MTWMEFKESCERAGIKDEDTLWYIDMSFEHHHGFDGQPSLDRREGFGVGIGD